MIKYNFGAVIFEVIEAASGCRCIKYWDFGSDRWSYVTSAIFPDFWQPPPPCQQFLVLSVDNFDQIGVGKGIKKLLKFDRNELRF